jgi:hypothetical protein
LHNYRSGTLDMNCSKFIALLLLIFQASSASALTRPDCEKDYETCLGSDACKIDEPCQRRCQYFYLTCLSYAAQNEK